MRKNITKDFVASFITKQLDVWKLEIERCRKMQEEKGKSRSIALLEAILQSVFEGNVNLFFKVIGEACSKEYIALTEFDGSNSKLEAEIRNGKRTLY